MNTTAPLRDYEWWITKKKWKKVKKNGKKNPKNNGNRAHIIQFRPLNMKQAKQSYLLVKLISAQYL